MDTYYTLTSAGIGERAIETEYHELLVTADPRQLPLTEIGKLRDLDAAELVGATEPHYEQLRLATVTPVGEVRPSDYEPCLDADGWLVATHEPIDAVLGPQAADLIAAITKMNAVYGIDDDVTKTYDEAVEAQYGEGPWIAQGAADAAQDALDEAGADGHWWAARAFGCCWGEEMLALAARDLLGTLPGWDQAAYDLLVAPWRTAFGADQLTAPPSKNSLIDSLIAGITGPGKTTPSRDHRPQTVD